MRPSTLRRLAILAEGEFGPHNAKTAYGVIRYGRDDVAAVIDSTRAGQNVDAYLPGHDIPIVATLADALAIEPPPDALLIGIAPTGGRLPQSWRTVILDAIAAGLDVLSGLHTFIGDDPEFAAAAAAAGSTIVDYRRPPERMETAVGRRHAPGKRVILTVGSDCAIGKMSVALELRRAAQTSGDSVAFVATGQTGMMIEGWGVAVDRLISDFAQGTVEWLVGEGEELGDWVIVEGQGSLDHPAYSSVTLALIHGSTPQAMVMVHDPGLREHDFDHLPEASFPIAKLPGFIAMHEGMANLVAPSKVVAIALNTSRYADEDEARRLIASTEAETGLPDRRPVPLRTGTAVGPDPRGGRRAAVGRRRCPGRRTMTLRLTHEVLHLGLIDPLRIARTDHHSDASLVTTVVVELTDDRFPGIVGVGEGYPDRFYGETPETMAAIFPYLLSFADGFVDELTDPATRPRGARVARPDLGGQPALERRGQVRPRHRRPRLRRQGPRPPGPSSCSTCRAPSRRPTSRSASTSPTWSPNEPPGRPTSRPSRSSSAARRTSRRSGPSAASSPVRSASTPTPAGPATTRSA